MELKRDPLAIEMEGLRHAVEAIITERDRLRAALARRDTLLRHLFDKECGLYASYKVRIERELNDSWSGGK